MSYCGARVGEYLPTGQVGVHACGTDDKHPFLMLGAKKLQLHKCERDGCGIVWFDTEAPAPALNYARKVEALMTGILTRLDADRPARRRRRKQRRA